MKHWKNLLVCLLAGVLALGVLTACSGLGSVNTGTDAEKAAELARQLGVAYAPELDNTAKAVAEWFVQEPDSLQVSGLDLVYTVALDADSNMSHTDDLNAFLYWSGCYGVPKDVTVALLLDDSAAMTAQLYAPQADSAAAKLLEDAAGHSEMGAAPSSTTTALPMSWQCSGKHRRSKGRSVERPFFGSGISTVNALRCLTFERSEHIHD